MAWPPSLSNLGEIHLGYLNAVWGTSGVLPTLSGANTPSNCNGMIVESISGTDDVEKIYIENGDGIRCHRALLIQGRTVNVTFADDTGLSQNTVSIGATFTVYDPLSRSSGLSFKIVETKQDSTRKKEGTRTVTAEITTGIEGLPLGG